MRIDVLSHDLSENCLGRAHILAKLLSSDNDVRIIGPASRGEIWAPLAHDTSIKYVQLPTGFHPIQAARVIDGDVVYAVKPQTTSFGYALLVQKLKRTPVILDIDDWDLGFFLSYPWKQKVTSSLNANNMIMTWLLEKLTKRADAITVSNRFLAERFGGELIPHFRDTDELDPEKFDGSQTRRELGVKERHIVMFVGTVREHKGIDVLIEALDQLGRSDVAVVLVGVDWAAQHFVPDRPYVYVVGPQPFDKLPTYLAAADLVVLMQKSTRASVGQVPAKVFDAMAMAKPIIATDVSDLPNILDGCGIIIKADSDAYILAASIDRILNDADLGGALGRAGRDRCIRDYSVTAMQPRLQRILQTVAVRASP
jgi:glycosyltransferase involved in cell wall biosynthesis